MIPARLRRPAVPLVLLFGIAASAAAQEPTLARADSVLVGRILLAEDGREANAAALAEGLAHRDPRIRHLAARARGRTLDPVFALRDSLRPDAPAPEWPEPEWRLRLRALTPQSACSALEPALRDSVWPVRQRAATLAAKACTGNAAVVTALREWLSTDAAALGRRAADGTSWHPAAAALPVLAQLDAAAAVPFMARYAAAPQWPLRRAVARAARIVADTARLRTLVRDRDANVREAAIEALAALTGHADDALFLQALRSRDAQAVRAAAVALKGSSDPAVPGAARAAWRRWVARGNASEADVRVALLEAAGGTAAEDQPPARPAALPPAAVRLALGADVRLRVTMAPASGGGSFIVRLRGDVAPLMAGAILALVERRYYDGLTWHRVEHDFVIQGGSPGANEYVGHPRFLRDELGTLAHPRGTVGMSTRGHDTGDAQWFINLRPNARLRRDYTVFGEVIEGIDVVDAVVEGDRIGTIRVVR